jgi:hypothetical protein
MTGKSLPRAAMQLLGETLLSACTALARRKKPRAENVRG